MNNILTKWKAGLARTSRVAFGNLQTLFGATEISAQTWENLEGLLIQADIGIETTESIIESLKSHVKKTGITKAGDLVESLRSELRQRLDAPPAIVINHHPSVILIVGVNGSGKTTSIAKLGHLYKKQGKSVVFGGADTFRAAATDQLQIWADKLGIMMISGQMGGDAGAVAYDTVQAAANRKADIALIDTAGRLHTRYNLMEELKKVYRVVGKAYPDAPHHVWLVLDATTGQNALPQARAFRDAVRVTGIILAKLDSSAKGGMAFAIQKELALPILFAGLGEKPDDLQIFDPDAFVTGILAS